MAQIDYTHPRNQIVAIMNRIYENGMTTTSGGNLSILDPANDMWISPSGIDKGTLRPDDIICVRADGTIEGPHKPSCEFPFHRDIYKMRGGVKAILHAHPPTLVSFSVAGKIPDTNVLPVAKSLCGDIGFAPYDIPGSEALGRKVAAEFAKGPSAIILENHGTCLADSSLVHAFIRFETLDFCARSIYNAGLLGGAKPLSQAQLADFMTNRNTAFTPFEPELRSSVELELREKTAALIRRSYRQKLFTGASGSYAVRVSGSQFLVTPHGCDRAEIQAGDLVLIDGARYEAGKTPSERTWFFKAVLDAQPDVNAVTASIPPYIAAYLIAHASFDPRVIPESFIQLRETPAFPFGAYFQDTAAVAKTLSNRYPVILVENDAVFTCGKTPLEAFDRLEVTEYSAKATIAAQSFGGMKPIDDKQVADLVEAFNLIP